jgi:hypothetical protein
MLQSMPGPVQRFGLIGEDFTGGDKPRPYVVLFVTEQDILILIRGWAFSFLADKMRGVLWYVFILLPPSP